MEIKKTALIVIAHPDDETLLAGGTIGILKDRGYRVSVVTVASNAEARSTGSGSELIREKQSEVFSFLGIDETYNLGFPDSLLSTVPHLDLVQKIEDVFRKEYPEIVITHFPYDNHTDHKVVSACCREAFRVFQRPEGQLPAVELWYGEVPSSTDWSLETQISPNLYVPIGKSNFERKVGALSMYHKVLRPFPHSRSRIALEGLAAYRGAQAGTEYAEAFQQVFRVF